MDLLHAFVLKLGGGQLPTRLQKVLPQALDALQRADVPSSASQARERLRQKLQQFQCCRGARTVAEPNAEPQAGAFDEEAGTEQHCNVEAEEEEMSACEGEDAEAGHQAIDVVEVESSQEETEGGSEELEVCERLCIERDCDVLAGPGQLADIGQLASMSGDAGQACKESTSHLFRKINEWTNMMSHEKRTCLKQLKLECIQGAYLNIVLFDIVVTITVFLLQLV